MNKYRNIYINFSLFTLLSLFITSCENKEIFTIKGKIAEAEGKTLYFSHTGINKNTTIDSVKLGHRGDYKFTAQRPESYEFYRLILSGEKVPINVAIDSTETVVVTSKLKNFASDFTVEGSENTLRIKELIALQNSLQQQVDYLMKHSGPAIGETKKVIYNLILEFKDNIIKEHIIPHAGQASAYYALFLRLNNAPLFDPQNNRKDSKCFSAVANSINDRYPHSLRGMNLYNIAVKGVISTRPIIPDTLDLNSPTVEKRGLFDLRLPNIKGDTITLSSLKGKVALLDFTAYKDPKMGAHNIELRGLYEKYKNRGFEIYQVSFDENIHFWKTSADNLPWICVRDGKGVKSTTIVLYHLDKLPAYFLINRENELVLRDNQIENLPASIEKLLNE